MNFNGCSIKQDSDGDITMDIIVYFKSIRRIEIFKARRKKLDKVVTPDKYNQYSTMEGSLIWAGDGVLPQASYVVSYM